MSAEILDEDSVASFDFIVLLGSLEHPRLKQFTRCGQGYYKTAFTLAYKMLRISVKR